MSEPWGFLTNVGIVSVGLLVATVARWRFRFLQRYLIPNALTAGFLLLPLYNYVVPNLGVRTDYLGDLVYHLLNVSFIAMTLRGRERTDAGARPRGTIIGMSVATLWMWGVQALIGLALTAVFIATTRPELFPAFGILLPLGFAQGPGQAFSIGQGWARFGIEDAGTIGLTFAAVGFVVASFGGIFLINLGVRRGWLDERFKRALQTSPVRTGIYPPPDKRPPGAFLATESEAIDSFSFHLALVFAVYLVAYGVVLGLTSLLARLGPLGQDLAVNLWGINFIFSALTALAIRAILTRARVAYVFDNTTLTRISGLSVDFMVAAAIAAISIVAVRAFIVPILVLSAAAAAVTIVLVPWYCSRLFGDHQFHRTMMIFGVSTGTLPTGLALLRVLDPEFETPVSHDYVLASGLTFMLAIPFILAINLPVYAVTRQDPRYFVAALAVAGGYILVCLIALAIIARKRALGDLGKVWLRPGVAARKGAAPLDT